MGLYLIAEFSWVSPETWMNILKVALGLGMVIFVHELGHFLVAKACGVKCEKFYVGFDVPLQIGPLKLPSSLWKKQWGETLYGIGIIPLGGYVKMLGQDDNPGNAAAEAERTKLESENPEGEAEIDPRSYTAKTVPQRMAIISAGVIMNVIFAVIFATIAFRLGVSYMPCEIGGTVPGDPAWIAGLEPGDRIIQIGESGLPKEHLRFRKDLLTSVVFAGDEEDIDFRIRSQDGQEKMVRLRPSNTHLETLKHPTIGVRMTKTTTLSKKYPVLEKFPADQANPPFQGGDKIVGVEVEGQQFSIDNYYRLQEILAQHPEREMTFRVERSLNGESLEEKNVTVAPNPVRTLGLVMKLGPITAIQKNSLAEKAGLQVGDLIKTVNGDSNLDAMHLPDLIRRLAGSEIELGIAEKGSAESQALKTIKVTPEKPKTYENDYTSGSPQVLHSLGLVYSVLNTVEAVLPDSPADKAGMTAGDEIAGVQFIAADDEKREYEATERMLTKRSTTIEFKDNLLNWPYAYSRMQWSLADTKVKLVYQRAGILESTEPLSFVASDQWFNPTRGLGLTGKSEEHLAASWSEAASLGLRETKESLQQILVFLKKIATGGMSALNLGGPGTIAVVATSEASQGTARLLIFLTLLSANLAIINFLPIPVLDGGHMVFLAFEGIRGKPVDEKWAFRLTIVGLTFLLGLMVFVIGLDIFRLSGLAG